MTSSSLLKGASEEGKASLNQQEVSHSYLFPRISLDGSYRYVTEVPSLQTRPGTSIQFGDHSNYSIGPVLSWRVFDGGSRRDAWEGSKLFAESKRESLANIKLLTFLQVRLAYHSAQLARNEWLVVADSLKLSINQEKDISRKAKLGASSRLDQLLAKKEVLNFRMQLNQAQLNRLKNMHDLYALIGGGGSEEGNKALDIELDAIDEGTISREIDSARKLGPPKDDHPQLRTFSLLKESVLKTSQGISSSRWPQIDIMLKSTWEYPDGPVLKDFNQNTAAIFMTVPLFEGDRTRNQALQKSSEALAFQYKNEQTRKELQRDWDKALIAFENLQEQTKLGGQAVTEAKAIGDLTYESYKAGKASYLDVQGANLRILEARVQSVRFNVQLLNQIAMMKSISGAKE